MSAETQQSSARVGIAVVVAALGYLVDIYDLILFGVVRRPSLMDLGVRTPEALADVGGYLISMQMFGMLIGGVLWGVFGDRRGRLSVLFGSILMYSIANVLNGFVTSVDQYAALRVFAGIGLAGELGAGVTLVSELIDKKNRGYATAIIAGVGICGALLAVGVSKIARWNVAYWIGGGLGFALLLLRIGVIESGMFARVKESKVSRGNFLAIFAKWDRARRYIAIVLIGVPIWYVIGLLMTFCDDIGASMGMDPAPDPANALFFMYSGLVVGDLGSGFISQWVKSRKAVLWGSIVLNAIGILFYFFVGRYSTVLFYGGCVLLGFGNGYWAVFVTSAAELFGTNLRATAATTAPNFVRGSVALITPLYKWMRHDLGWSALVSAEAIGALVIAIALVSMLGFEETYGRDLDFVEE